MITADTSLLEIFKQLRNPIKDNDHLTNYSDSKIFCKNFLLQKLPFEPFLNYKLLLDFEFQFNRNPKKVILELCLQALVSLDPKEIIKAFLKMLIQWKDHEKDVQATQAFVEMSRLITNLGTTPANKISSDYEFSPDNEYNEYYLFHIHTLLARRLTAIKNSKGIELLLELAPTIYLESLLFTKKIKLSDALIILRNVCNNRVRPVAADISFFNRVESRSFSTSVRNSKSILQFNYNFELVKLIINCFSTNEDLSTDESIMFLENVNLILDHESCHGLINVLFIRLIEDLAHSATSFSSYQNDGNKKSFLIKFLKSSIGNNAYEIIFKKLCALFKKFKNIDALDFLMDIQQRQIQSLTKVCVIQKIKLNKRPDIIENIARVLGQANKQKLAPITTLPVELLTNICTFFSKPDKEQQAEICARSIIENNGRAASM